mgnify:CR=1 FL=1
MSEKKQIKLTPFELARINIKKTAENFNLYNSIEMLAFALDGFDKLSEEEKETLNTMFKSVLEDMSSFLEEKGHQWN